MPDEVDNEARLRPPVGTVIGPWRVSGRAWYGRTAEYMQATHLNAADGTSYYECRNGGPVFALRCMETDHGYYNHWLIPVVRNPAT